MRSKACIGLMALMAVLKLPGQEPSGTGNNDRAAAYDSRLAAFNWPVDDAYRRIQGTNYDLRPLFNWQRLPTAQQQTIPRPAPDWSTYELRIVNVAPDGLVASPISIDSVAFVGPAVRGVYFLTNFPGWATNAVDQVIRVTAKRCGTYAKDDSEETFKLLDYGQPQPFPPLEGTAAENFRLLAREMEQVNLGVAAFQYRVGVRYLQGDGVTQNVALARSLFQLAADQGHPDAAARLKSLSAGESPPIEPAPATEPVVPAESVPPPTEPTTPTP